MFNLVGIPPAPRGVPQIDVTFDIDVNGILNVSAKDLGTGKEQKITISASKKLSQEEIDRMVKDAEQYTEQDRQKKEESEARNQADSIIYSAEKTKSELKEKISSEQMNHIDQAVKELKEALSGKDLSKIKEKNESLTKTLQEIGSAVYQQAAKEQAKTKSASESAQKSDGKKDEKVVDAEYEVEDEKKS
jgi:molecular chaperone DnaK